MEKSRRIEFWGKLENVFCFRAWTVIDKEQIQVKQSKSRCYNRSHFVCPCRHCDTPGGRIFVEPLPAPIQEPAPVIDPMLDLLREFKTQIMKHRANQ